MTPVNEFEDNNNETKSSWANSEGIEPSSEFICRRIYSKLEMDPSSDGMLPVKQLDSIDR
jgi:hypothetical protein